MKILIGVICFNEEPSLAATLTDLLEHNTGYDIVVIDNGSSDRTQLVCRELGIPSVRHCVNTGASVGTLISYFAYAHAHRYEVLCQFDGDGQHIAAELPEIIGPLVRGEANCVIGSRFIEYSGFQSTQFRRVGIRLFSRLFTWLSGIPITDITSGFRAYDARLIEFFGHRYRDRIYDSMNQFLLLCFFAGFQIKEVPVRMRARRFGTSEFNFRNAVTFPLKGLIAFGACLLQRRRIKQLAG
jgi:glycosyltransferase involved in cell wall biosynthesis